MFTTIFQMPQCHTETPSKQSPPSVILFSRKVPQFQAKDNQKTAMNKKATLTKLKAQHANTCTRQVIVQQTHHTTLCMYTLDTTTLWELPQQENGKDHASSANKNESW